MFIYLELLEISPIIPAAHVCTVSPMAYAFAIKAGPVSSPQIPPALPGPVIPPHEYELVKCRIPLCRVVLPRVIPPLHPPDISPSL